MKHYLDSKEIKQYLDKPSKKPKTTSPIPTTAATSRNTQTPIKKTSQQEIQSKDNKASASKASDKPSIVKGEFKTQPATPTRPALKSIQTTPINVKSQKTSVISKSKPQTIS